MSSELAIKVENLSKCYRIYAKPHHRLLHLIRRKSKPYGQAFWALQSISFEVYKGETIGIIGRNGSGKSTLLQMICATLQPTSGTVSTNGRIAALLELGSGFNPDFTGRENVFLNASILGLSKKEVNACFDDIVSFAEIGSFIDQPVKTYSSGMFVRLAFAVTAHTNPSILVVDEALSVGDIAFQNKCVQKIQELKHKGTSILFVSHDLSTVQMICDRVFWLQNGSIRLTGLPAAVCQQYYAEMLTKTDSPPPSQSVIIPQQLTGNAQFINVRIQNEDGVETCLFYVGEALCLEFQLRAEVDLDEIVYSISVYRTDGDWSIGQTSREKGVLGPPIKSGNTQSGLLVLTPLSLTPGDYTVVLGAHSRDHQIFYALTDFLCHFSVRARYQTWGKFIHPCVWRITSPTSSFDD